MSESTPFYDTVQEAALKGDLTQTAMRLRAIFNNWFSTTEVRGPDREECYALVLRVDLEGKPDGVAVKVDLDAQAAIQQIVDESTVEQLVKRAVAGMTKLTHAQNVDVSFSAALETQQAITVLGVWLEQLDDHWRQQTLADLSGWKSPDELEEES